MARFIAHHGIKGQRWGVRRFQNEDGTLTEVGKKRYGSVEELEKDYRKADAQGAKAILDGTSNSLNTAGNAVGNIGKNKSKTINTKNYKDISDTELRNRINRLSMEKTYGELTGDSKKVRSGSDWAREVLQTSGAVVAIGASIAGIAVAINNIKLGKAEKKGG